MIGEAIVGEMTVDVMIKRDDRRGYRDDDRRRDRDYDYRRRDSR